MDYFVLFMFGLAVGSFLNVVIYRLKHGGSALKGRSYCDHCKKPIPWYDNIPLLSYLFLGGKSRCCKKGIPIEYPVVELLTGVQFVWVYWLLKINFTFFGQVEGFYSLALLIYWLCLFVGSMVIAIYDFKYMLIPGEVLWPLVAMAFLRLLITGQWQLVGVAVLSTLFIGLLWLVTRGKGMGLGDVQLAFLMGLVLGFPLIVIAYFVAFLTGAVTGVILIFSANKKIKDKIAFGPFLLFGMLVAKLWGGLLWQWYWGLVW